MSSLESSAGTSNQIQQVLLCSWGAPARRGSLICCNGLLVMQSVALASGVAGMFAGTLVRVAAQTSSRKKAAKAEFYDEGIQGKNDIVFNIADIQQIVIGKKFLGNTRIVIHLKDGKQQELFVEKPNDLRAVYPNLVV